MPLLFSYGMLQHEDVQIATFGRRLVAHADELVGFTKYEILVDDPRYATQEHFWIVAPVLADSRVAGVALELTDAELAAADAYEPAEYRRTATKLASGRSAWVYVDARFVSVSPDTR